MPPHSPSLSVIVPAYNEEAYIGAMLLRLVDLLDDSLGFEVVVVNNGSTDGTEDIVARFDKVNLINLKECITIAKARNIGVSFSTSMVLAFIDADVLITKKWVAQVRSDFPRFERSPLLLTGARYDLSERPSMLEKIWFARLMNKEANYLNGGNIITTRKLFDTIGGFNEDMVTGEDVEFCHRAQAKGATLTINNSYKTHHEGYPKNVIDFFKRELWHGMGDMQSVQAFLNSRVAIASVINMTFLCLCIISIILSKFHLAVVMLLVIFLLNVALTLYKFGPISPCLLFVNSLYHFVYLLARSLSFLKGREFD